MREIKFRAWDRINKTLYYNTEKHTVWAGGIEACVTGEDCPHKNISYEFTMQYTGLKDKNGKEIYEGDVVKVDNDWEKREIKWGFTSDHSSYMYQLGWNIWEEEVYEVIGNIYENPELLEKTT